MEPLHIEIDSKGPELVLRLEGALDISTAIELTRCVDQLLEMGARSRLVVDASNVGFMDSSGVQGLIVSHRRCADHDAQLVIRSPSPAVERILGVTGVDQVLAVERH